MDESLPPELLARYLAGEATAGERAAVDAWAAADPSRAADLDHMREAWAASTKARSRKPAPVALSDEVATGRSMMFRARWHEHLVARLALLVVLAGAAAFAVRVVNPAAFRRTQVFTTRVGETRAVTLADSTRVLLAPLTELRVNGKFGRTARAVDLTGEAWFEARHDSATSFQVRAFGTITETLGTTFSVRALAADSIVTVVLAEGSASVRLANAPIAQGATLNPRDAVQIETRTLRAHILRGVDVEALTGWRSGTLAFTNASIGDVAIELHRWYGITMRFASPDVAHRPVSYSIPTNDLAAALDVMGRSLVVRIERKGDTLFAR